MSSTHESVQWPCRRHPDINFTVEIPKQYETKSGRVLSLASLVQTIYWKCPGEGHTGGKWEKTSSSTFDLATAREQEANVKAVMDDEGITESYMPKKGVKVPYYAFDIYASAAPDFNPETPFPEAIKGDCITQGSSTTLRHLVEVSQYGPPNPPVTIAYGEDPRTHHSSRDIGWPMAGGTSDATPSLIAETLTSESNRSRRTNESPDTPGGSVTAYHATGEETLAGEGDSVYEDQDQVGANEGDGTLRLHFH